MSDAAADARSAEAHASLRRGLGTWSAMALVVGTIIGTGVFLKAAVMAQRAGSPSWVLAAWAIGGLLSIAGALSYAELGAMFPRAGGEYAFLREGYGPGVSFLYGWTRFWIGSPGSIAAYGVGAATFLEVPADERGWVAIGLIVVFTGINCLSVTVGGRLGAALTALKVALIVGLAVGALLFSTGGGWHHLAEHDGGGGGFPGWSALGLTVLAALWAYDGWNNLPMAAGEVRDPGRNLPRAIVGGTLVCLAVYAAVNVAYFHALPFDAVATSSSTDYPEAPSVAARVAATFLGDTAQGLLAFAMVVSALSAMNGSILTGARVPFAMAADGLAPRRLARIHPRTRVPVVAILIQGAWACVLARSGRFDLLTESVVFASWLFYALCAGAVLLLRARRPDHPRPFRVPGYPVVPVVFILVSILLLVNTVWNARETSATGLVIVAAGGLVYLVVFKLLARRA